MDERTLAAMRASGVRGPTDGESHGRGLSIVQALCDAQGIRFSIRSAPARGTRASIAIDIKDYNQGLKALHSRVVIETRPLKFR